MKNNHPFLSGMLGCVLCALPLPALAKDGPTLENQVPQAMTSAPNDKIVTLAVENDSLGGGSDRHYSSGVRLSYYDLNAVFPELIRETATLIPGFEINRTSSLIYSIGQNLYTPEDIERRSADPDDRPWAAYLYTSFGVATLIDNHIDEVEATVGIVGPGALGEPTQKFVHSIINSPDPQGWDHQLKSEPGLTLSWQRRWPEAASLTFGGLMLSADPYAGATVGNIHTYADTGIAFRFGSRRHRWEDTPLRVRPALPGTGYFDVQDRGWDWHLFGGAEGRAVARNIFLDGNTFRDSPSVDKEPLVGDLNLGVALTKGRMRVSYTAVYRTREFEGQDDPDVFGALSVGYRF